MVLLPAGCLATIMEFKNFNVTRAIVKKSILTHTPYAIFFFTPILMCGAYLICSAHNSNSREAKLYLIHFEVSLEIV